MNDDIMAIAAAVGVETIPDPKVPTLMDRVNRASDAAYEFVTKLEDKILDAAANITVHVAYIGRHRMNEPPLWKRVLRPQMAVAASIAVGLVSVLVPTVDTPAALVAIRSQQDNVKREISYFHYVINSPLES